jgi:hypothetical protein
VRLHLLDGTSAQASDWDWDFDAAKAIHRNLARVPKWALAAALDKPPRWLTQHVSQPTALGLVLPDGGIRWLGSGVETGLSYQADEGIVIKRATKPRGPREGWDESYD